MTPQDLPAILYYLGFVGLLAVFGSRAASFKLCLFSLIFNLAFGLIADRPGENRPFFDITPIASFHLVYGVVYLYAWLHFNILRDNPPLSLWFSKPATLVGLATIICLVCCLVYTWQLLYQLLPVIERDIASGVYSYHRRTPMSHFFPHYFILTTFTAFVYPLILCRRLGTQAKQLEADPLGVKNDTSRTRKKTKRKAPGVQEADPPGGGS